MKNPGYALFLIIVLSIHALINLYIFKSGWPAASWMGPYRYLALIVFVVLVLSYPVGRFAERMVRCGFIELLLYAGSFYLAMMVYFFLLILALDLLRLGNHVFHYFPAVIGRHPHAVNELGFLGSLALILALLVVGHLNALRPRVRDLSLTMQKGAGGLRTLRIVVASDLHLGRNVSDAWLGRVVDRINGLEPDLVLLPGDTMDEDINALSREATAAALRRIRARLGVFAVTGNHEYFMGVDEALEYLGRGNVRVLQDEVLRLGGSLYLAGRRDWMAKRFGQERRPLAELLEGLDESLPIILMDHQPFHLEEAEENGVDLQLSGHTHHGQLFPFQWITEAVYEVSWGYLRKGATHYYVSCGLGTWGPPVRLGNVPEILRVELSFQGPEDPPLRTEGVENT